MAKRWVSFGCLTAAAMVATTACKKSDEAAAPPVAAVPVDATQVTAKLAKADAYDGTEDKVVSKCAACALRMDGSDDYALEVHGYTMHFCSADCKESYEADSDGAVMAMKIPGG